MWRLLKNVMSIAETIIETLFMFLYPISLVKLLHFCQLLQLEAADAEVDTFLQSFGRSCECGCS